MILNLKDRINFLEKILKDNNVKLKDYENSLKNGDISKMDLYLLQNETDKIKNEIIILNKLYDLEQRYIRKEPIKFHYSDYDSALDISLSVNDINYETAYRQQKKLLELELRRLNGDLINGYGLNDLDYDAAYSKEKDSILKMKPKLDNQISFNNKNASSLPSVGGKHFKPNLLSAPYTLILNDGILYVVGNFTSDYLESNFDKLDINFIDENTDIKEVKLINDLDFGNNFIEGADFKINVSKDGNIDVIGNVDAFSKYNQEDELESNLSNDEEKVKDDKALVKSDDILDNKDISGLDVMPDMPEVIDLPNEDSDLVSSKTPIKRKKASPTLWQKFKNLSWQKKAMIVAGVIAIIGVGIFVIGPQVMNGINDLLNPENVNVVNNAVSTVNDTLANAPVSLDYSSIGEGQTVFTNAYDAVNNANGVISNEWFSSNPLDVFNTATNSYMGLSPEQLNDPAFMAELAKDPNNAILMGQNMANPSGFVGLDDVIREITKVR